MSYTRKDQDPSYTPLFPWGSVVAATATKDGEPLVLLGTYDDEWRGINRYCNIKTSDGFIRSYTRSMIRLATEHEQIQFDAEHI